MEKKTDEIAKTITINLSDAPIIQQISKKQEEDKTKCKNNFLLFGLLESSSDCQINNTKQDY